MTRCSLRVIPLGKSETSISLPLRRPVTHRETPPMVFISRVVIARNAHFILATFAPTRRCRWQTCARRRRIADRVSDGVNAVMVRRMWGRKPWICRERAITLGSTGGLGGRRMRHWMLKPTECEAAGVRETTSAETTGDIKQARSNVHFMFPVSSPGSKRTQQEYIMTILTDAAYGAIAPPAGRRGSLAP